MVTLRPATQFDAVTIRQMVRQARINPTGLDWQRFTVAETEAGQIIGCVQVKSHQDNARELASLVVLPSWQGRGVAGSLIMHLLTKESGPIYLMCRSGLVPFYTKYGFRPLEPLEMPLYFRRIHRLFQLMQGVLRHPEQLVVMFRQGPDRSGEERREVAR